MDIDATGDDADNDDDDDDDDDGCDGIAFSFSIVLMERIGTKRKSK